MLLMAVMQNCSAAIGRRASPSPVLALMFLVGCGAGTSGGATYADTPGGLASGLASAFCAAQAICCGSDGGTVNDGAAPGASLCSSDGGAGDDPSTCLPRATLSASQQLALVGAAFNEGLLNIDSTTATVCIQAYQNVGCTELASQAEPAVQAALGNPACATLFTGNTPVGERCDMTAECVPGSYCLSPAGGQLTSIEGNGTLGICFAYQPMGGACNTTDDCLPPLACDPATQVCQ